MAVAAEDVRVGGIQFLLMPEHTFGEWIYNRLRKQGALDEEVGDRPWGKLTQQEVDFWNHEAQAYFRAALRGGFRDYYPELGSGEHPGEQYAECTNSTCKGAHFLYGGKPYYTKTEALFHGFSGGGS